jgi:pimeloyl-ACP methyl ester carboxylesterase
MSRTVRSNGIDLHVTEMGEGPPVVLCHGFPETSYSWRHQLPALAAAGYHVLAPDQRGYGRSGRPEPVEAYDILHLTDDMLGLLDAIGVERAVFVGHDWGAPVVWTLALRAPERVAGVAALSVAFPRRGQIMPIERQRELFGDSWAYMLYFQEPGVADAGLGRDPATTMRRMLTGLTDRGGLTGPRDGRGMVERMSEPAELPGWLTQADLDHFAAEFARTGFTGPINWYRNIDRNWDLMSGFEGAQVEVPALFIAGRADPVLAMGPPEKMTKWVPDLRGIVLLDDTGHWVQQERPTEVNAALLDFLAGLPPWSR